MRFFAQNRHLRAGTAIKQTKSAEQYVKRSSLFCQPGDTAPYALLEFHQAMPGSGGIMRCKLGPVHAHDQART